MEFKTSSILSFSVWLFKTHFLLIYALHRHTPAQGGEFEGCPCHTYQFGCCPDGVTIATGPNLQGCVCQQSKYGCCGDEVTAARGPNMDGCDCSNSKYGCCPDGVTESQGKNFLNCTDIPENRQGRKFLVIKMIFVLL